MFLMLAGILPAAGNRAAQAAPAAFSTNFDTQLDRDGNGLEDLLDAWLQGRTGFGELRAAAVAAPLRVAAAAGDTPDKSIPRRETQPAAGSWQAGQVRLICLGTAKGAVAGALAAGARAGQCRLIHSIDRFGGISVLAGDEPGLRAFLAEGPNGRILLDRDGVPALADSRGLAGAPQLETGRWALGDDWSATVAILDSGCDTAHGDLGDSGDDDQDGPPPGVGDAGDWFPADNGWPLFGGYKVVGWHDVTDDFPLAAGPWDYHHHGTALASVVAGSGTVDYDYRGMAPGGRFTVVKYYDFDETWHAWAGDFLAACAWTLDNRETYRIRTVLAAVNWDVDAGISAAMSAFVAAGLVPVVAAGNEGISAAGLGFPASLPDVLTVGAVNATGAVSAFSSRGLSTSGKPDLLAPGGGLRQSSGRIVAADIEPNDSYSGRFGTSLAAAHVAGALYLLDEALLENGIILPGGENSIATRTSLLKLTAAPVLYAEDHVGSLPFPAGPDAARGWGLLRVDAAVEAALMPLHPGRDQLDNLTGDWEKPVVARRLITSPQVRYLIEAVPSGSLDVVLEVADPRWLDDPSTEGQVRRQDANGPGVSEFTYLRPDPGSWLVMVVKRKSGQGTVSLKLREADSFLSQSASATLPGLATGAPNSGSMIGLSGPTLLVPSRVTVDLGARSLSALDTDGNFLPGWPVFVFPHSSSQGGLTLPLAWDLDGVPGDEVVVASDFGSVYFFAGSGAIQEITLDLNQNLTNPVGILTSAGSRRVAVVDKDGTVRTWSHGPVLEAMTDLGHNLPLSPAAGVLIPGAGESLVVAFADGHVTALDDNLDPLPGWPRNLGPGLKVAPVLVDLDEDGFHEIVLPALDSVTGQATMRVLTGTGLPAAGDGSVVPAPEGGSWLELSPAVVAGGYTTGDLRVALTGLADNGLFGDQDSWVLGRATLSASGVTGSSVLPGFRVRASTSQGLLTLDHILLPAPLAWNFKDGSGTEVRSLVSMNWSEVLIGITSFPGSCTTWLGPPTQDRPLVLREPLTIGGKLESASASAGAMLVAMDDGVPLRVDVLDLQVGIQPVHALKSSQSAWTAARGDGRNSGAFPLRATVSPVPDSPVGTRSLVAFPNPGSGHFQFRLSGVSSSSAMSLEIFDLRGRRVRTMKAQFTGGAVKWDGNDRRGRPLAAGTYLAVVRGAGEPLVTRVVLTR